MEHRRWMMLAAMAALASQACGDEGAASEGATTGCPPGVICGAGGDTGGPGAGPSGAGGSGPTMSGGGGGCVEAWECTPWDGGGTDDGVRTCVDKNGCGTTSDKPVEQATLPPLDFLYYQCKVDPIMNRGCAQQGCHGTEEGRALRLYHRGRLRNVAETITQGANCGAASGQPLPLTECVGSIECGCFTKPKTTIEWQRNYDASRGMLLDTGGVPLADPEESDFVRQPVIGGKPHAGVHLFSETDADYQTLVSWLGGAMQASCVTNN